MAQPRVLSGARNGEPPWVHMGPFPLPRGGTLTSWQRGQIWKDEKTEGCSASVRRRTQWESRCLTISGLFDEGVPQL